MLASLHMRVILCLLVLRLTLQLAARLKNFTFMSVKGLGKKKQFPKKLLLLSQS